MAEWRALGCVPDSEEDDDSQLSDQSEHSAERAGFDNKDNIERDVERICATHKPSASSEGSACETKEAEAEKTTDAQEHKRLAHLRPQPGIADIDELQQDHYEAIPVPRPGIQWLVAVEVENRRRSLSSYHSKPSPCQESITSSPLSEPPLSPSAISFPEVATSVQPAETIGPASRRLFATSEQETTFNIHGLQDDQGIGSDDVIFKNSRASHHLRHRNPIQLHPYAIEGEKYRQILKARGVKPLRIAQFQENHESQNEYESQGLGFATDGDSQPQSNNVESQDQIGPSSSLDHEPPNSSSSQRINFDPEDEFPDVGVLLRTHPSHTAVGTSKRRKVAHTYSKKVSQQGKGYSNSPETSPLAIDPIYEVPHSPPTSDAVTPRVSSPPHYAGFRVPLGISPVKPRTPVTSSEPRLQSVTEHHRFRSLSVSSAELSDGESEKLSNTRNNAFEKETGHHIKRVQRKMRGVLPASWLRLDLKTQKQKPDNGVRSYRSISPDRPDMQRGVARHLVPHRSFERGTEMDSPIVVSDDENSDSSHDQFTRPASADTHSFHSSDNFENHASGGFLDTNTGEVLEDNRIDEMLPSGKSLHVHTRKRRKRQTRLPAAELVKSRSTVSSLHHHRIKSAYQPRITDHIAKGCKSRFRPPNLSILDAPKQHGTMGTPRFLKIASRTARSRIDQGRHSPTRKFIQLATNSDTNESRETLRNWREGTILPVKYPPHRSYLTAPNRQPLRAGSGNRQPSSNLTRKIERIRPRNPRPNPGAINARILKARKGRVKPTKGQISLDSVVRPQTTEMNHAKNSSDIKRLHNTGSYQIQDFDHRFTMLRDSKDSRPALLESLQRDDDQSHPRKGLQRHISSANRVVHLPGSSNILLDRFLDKNATCIPTLTEPTLEHRRLHNECAINQVSPKILLPSRSRKRQPRRMNVNNPRFRQNSPSIRVEASTDHQPLLSNQDERRLQGLESFGTRYTQDFDVVPLPMGIYFHSSTFIGSGRFHKSLQLDRHAKMDIQRGSAKFQFGQEVFSWSSWNDTVSTQLGSVFELITEHLQPLSTEINRIDCQRASHMLTNVIQYFSDHLNFLDQIDRVSLLQRCKALLLMLSFEVDARLVPSDESQQDLRLHVLTLLLVFTNQLRQISAHELAPQNMKSEFHSLVSSNVERILRIVLNEAFENLPACLENLKHLEACEHGIREQSPSIEALVISYHVLRKSDESLALFWEIVRSSILDHTSFDNLEVWSLEKSWRKVFTILPFLAFDTQGLLESDQKLTSSSDGWSCIKPLVSVVFELHIANPKTQGATFNHYCRALFGRCLHLVNAWDWNRCESMIGTMFDFFAHNKLAHLSNEESHGSPRFLEHFAQTPDLKAGLEDRCFHLFLKIIGTGLVRMREIYPEKKIRDIVWRLMPNHGRLHPKEETLERRDLDALRNHHDLLSTLYWAASPAVRPRLGVIRNLVHLESSHRQACHINIRAWFNLVQFQLSTGEDRSTLEPFGEWHSDILEQLLRQHDSARTEAEHHIQSAEYSGSISNHVLESTITRNQRQVTEILGDALVSLKLALCAVKNQEQANILLNPALIPVFGLFDARKPHANKTVIQALDILSAYTNQLVAKDNQSKTRATNDDSQDYGDWSAFDDDDILPRENELPPPHDFGALHLFNHFYEPVKQLLSNCFGADTVPEDGLLSKLVDDWVAMANVLVRQGSKSWSDYISPFGLDSWGFLRQTEQTQKYTNYYMAVLIENNRLIYQEHTSIFLTSWIESLVERESLIKFQHRFTTAVLNIGFGDPMLKNIPFWMDPKTNRFNVTASEFLTRRLSLISSLLSNMRESLEDAHLEMSNRLPALKQEYQLFLKHLMSAMKRNYQALGHGSNVQGAYIEFVQCVIEFLQQYTSDICVIDRFFTDSTAFPLPATDPTYVVGRLKSYGLRLHDSRTPKQLVVFLQSVSERAAVDGQQNYLVGQLHTAMSNVTERGILSKPTLQSFVVQAIVPAYIEMAFSAFSGWLLASPILQALRDVFRGLLTSLDGTSALSIAGVVSIMTAFADSVQKSMALLVDHSGLLEQSHILRLLGLIYSAITALLPTIDYIVRLSERTPQIVVSVEFFKSFATFSSKLLLNHEDAQSPEIDGLNDIVTGPFDELREFALKELRDSLSKNWSYHDGRYYVIRGNSRRDVFCNDIPYEEEKTKLLLEFDDFFECLGGMPALGDKRTGASHRRPGVSVGEELLF